MWHLGRSALVPAAPSWGAAAVSQPCPLPRGHLPTVQLSQWHGATSVALVWDRAGGRSWRGCGTHGQLRLRAVEVGIEEHGDVAVTSLQRDGNGIVTVLKRKGEQLGRGLGMGCGADKCA